MEVNARSALGAVCLFSIARGLRVQEREARQLEPQLCVNMMTHHQPACGNGLTFTITFKGSCGSCDCLAGTSWQMGNFGWETSDHSSFIVEVK